MYLKKKTKKKILRLNVIFTLNISQKKMKKRIPDESKGLSHENILFNYM